MALPDDKIARLEAFKGLLLSYENGADRDIRSAITRERSWVQREVLEAGCFKTVTISPPPAVGGLVIQNANPFDMIFDPPYFHSLIPVVLDMVDETIGVLAEGGEPLEEDVAAKASLSVELGFVFVAMPMDPADQSLVDVLEAIKAAAGNCGLRAERIDDEETSERITDRILESIRRAEFVVVDLTGAKPNVYYEAGYAQGIGKTPIYVARQGTDLHFDLKDYPAIFFENLKQLRERLEARLRALAAKRVSAEA